MLLQRHQSFGDILTKCWLRKILSDIMPTVSRLTGIKTELPHTKTIVNLEGTHHDESSSLPYDQPLTPVKASQKRKRTKNLEPPECAGKSFVTMHPSLPPKTQLPRVPKKDDISRRLTVTKPNCAARLKSLQTVKRLASTESVTLEQLHQEEDPSDNKSVKISTEVNQASLDQNRPFDSYLSASETLEGSSEGQLFQCDEQHVHLEKKLRHQKQQRSENFHVPDPYLEHTKFPSLAKLCGHSNTNTFTATVADGKAHPDHIPLQCTKSRNNDLPVFQNFPTDINNKYVYPSYDGFLANDRDNVPLNEHDLSMDFGDDSVSSIDDCFPVTDDDIQQMIQLADTRRVIGSSDNDCKIKEVSEDPWLLENEDDLDILCTNDSIHSSGQSIHSAPFTFCGLTFNDDDSNSQPCPTPKFSENIGRFEKHPISAATSSKKYSIHGVEELYEDDGLDLELLKLTTTADMITQEPSPPTLPIVPVFPPQNNNHPIYLAEPAVSIPPFLSLDVAGVPVPFVRPPFARVIKDRSPILGLNSQMALRTCFRIGEALNAATIALRTDTDTIIELYARVMSSERRTGSFKQEFLFADLFTNEKPPFLHGNYILWRDNKLWDIDSKVFLEKSQIGKMARAVGRIKRTEEKTGWGMVIMSIWQVDWEDIGVAKGIVCS